MVCNDCHDMFGEHVRIVNPVPLKKLDMVFTWGREGKQFWAFYRDEHYESTTAQGRTLTELIDNCKSAAETLLSMEHDRRIVPNLRFKQSKE